VRDALFPDGDQLSTIMLQDGRIALDHHLDRLLDLSPTL
jgi:hypothetical protein